ncbi:MAG: PRD domain-containing protein [Longicatena sp.]
MAMILIKPINNNVALVNSNGKEYMVVGNGISFGIKIGNSVDDAKIDKTYFLENNEYEKDLISLIQSVPLEYVELAQTIIKEASNYVQVISSTVLLVALIDHIYNSVQNSQRSNVFIQPFKWDIKRIYPVEYKIGMMAVKMTNTQMHASLNEDEACAIALHFINNTSESSNMNETLSLTELISETTNILEEYASMKLCEDSGSFARFITHLTFLLRKKTREETDESGEENDSLLSLLSKRYVEANACTLKIEEMLKERRRWSFSNSETLYLLIHIQRILTDHS